MNERDYYLFCLGREYAINSQRYIRGLALGKIKIVQNAQKKMDVLENEIKRIMKI